MRLLRTAHEAGFRINLAFVGLSSVELSGSRVTDRVGKGGHAVPSDDLLRRYPVSLKNLSIVAAMADRSFVFDNSTRKRRLLLIRNASRNRYVAPDLPAGHNWPLCLC